MTEGSTPVETSADQAGPNEVVSIVLPCPVDAWCAMVEGLSKVYPEAKLLDSESGLTRIKLGPHVSS